MLEKPLVSIVVSLWKQERHIDACVRSILSQTYPHIEVVFVDNNASKKVIEKVTPYLSNKSGSTFRLVHEPVQGIASARSRGVLEAEGEFVAFLDSDDLMVPERIALQVESLQAVSGASMAVCLYDFISPEGDHVLTKGWFPRPEMWARLLLGKGFDPGTPFYDSHPSTMLFSRRTALEVGLFDLRFNPFWYEDSEFSLRMHMKGPIQLVNESLVSIRRTSEEYKKVREGQVDWVRFKNTDLFFQILVNHFDSKDFRFRKCFSKIRSRWLLEQSYVYFLSRGGRRLGMAMLLRSLRENPLNIKSVSSIFQRIIHQGERLNSPEIPTEYASIEYVNRRFLK